MREKDFTRYSAPRAKVAEIVIEAGFAATTISTGGSATLSGFGVDPNGSEI